MKTHIYDFLSKKKFELHTLMYSMQLLESNSKACKYENTRLWFPIKREVWITYIMDVMHLTLKEVVWPLIWKPIYFPL